MKKIDRAVLIAMLAVGMVSAAQTRGEARGPNGKTVAGMNAIRHSQVNKQYRSCQFKVLDQKVQEGRSTVSSALMWKPGEHLYIDTVRITPPESGATSPYAKFESISHLKVIKNPIKRAWYNLMHGNIKYGYRPTPGVDRSSFFGPDQIHQAISMKRAARIFGSERGGELRKNFQEVTDYLKDHASIYGKAPASE